MAATEASGEGDTGPIAAARNQLQAGDPAAALRALETATAGIRAQPQWIRLRAAALHAAGHYAEAERTLRPLLRTPAGDASRAWWQTADQARRIAASAWAQAAAGRAAWLAPAWERALAAVCRRALGCSRPEQAQAQAVRLLARDDPSADALRLAALVFDRAGDTGQARRAYARVVEQDPGDAPAHAALARCARAVAHWPSAARAHAVLRQYYAAGDFAAPREQPFRVLAWCADDACNRDVAAAAWRRECAGVAFESGSPPALSGDEVPGRDRPLRVGYLSANWCDSATLALAVGVFEHHDPAAVNVFVYCYSPQDGCWLRQRLRSAVPHFVDLHHLSDPEAAARIRADGIDVLVDSKGFTRASRSRILAYRPAPIQVNWLAFPGSMGSDAHDYIIADPTVIPEGAEAAFSEAVCRLPESYQPNDQHRPVATAPERAQEGLPAEALVFCCFNQAYKLEPVRWATFMAILRDVPGSILWLLDPGADARANLAAEAQAAGVDPQRLHYAPRGADPLHLARLGHADLALDTRIYNGHTTTSDALWAGVPVLATQGWHFASRVSASLLQACDLADCVLADEAALHARAVALARDPQARHELRQRLADNRFRAPLYDSERFTRHLEAAYRQMAERAAHGHAPADLHVAPEPPRREPFASAHLRARVNEIGARKPATEHDPRQQWTQPVCPVCGHEHGDLVARIPWTTTLPSDAAALHAGMWYRCRRCGHEYTRYYWAPDHALASQPAPVRLSASQARRLIRQLPDAGRKPPSRSQRRGKRRERAGGWLEVRPADTVLAGAAHQAGYSAGTMEAPGNLDRPAGLTVHQHNFLATRVEAQLAVLSLPGVLACAPFPDLYLHRAAGLLAPGSRLLLTLPPEATADEPWPEVIDPGVLHRFSEHGLQRLLHDTGFERQTEGVVPGTEAVRWLVARRTSE